MHARRVSLSLFLGLIFGCASTNRTVHATIVFSGPYNVHINNERYADEFGSVLDLYLAPGDYVVVGTVKSKQIRTTFTIKKNPLGMEQYIGLSDKPPYTR